ncbi:MAG: bifunctional sulfate adenylyltransferase subunit 1/adenylylsulfate kinase, partial [Mycobacterium sp.]
MATTTTLLRLATAGSVDDGKSTLIGRLLYDSKAVMEDQWAAVEQTSKERGHDYTDLALVTDGLRAEREQGITIDVAYRYFATPKRKFIIADTPGHIQYTRNMVTGASTAQLVIVLVDARHGLLEQSRRHAFLASLLGIQHIVLAVNKMDLIGWDRDKFESIRDEFHAFAARLDVHDVATIPISALHGDNVVTKSDHTPWYEGPALLSHLEEVYIAGDRNLVDVRFPVQYVIRPHTHTDQDHRSYAGTVASGVMRPGDEVIVLPIGKVTRITAIDGPNGPVEEAFPPMAVSMSLADEIDISRGDLIARTNNQPRIAREFDATVCWMADNAALEAGRDYLIKHTTRTTHARVTALDYRLDVNTLHRDKSATALKLNELGRISLRTQVPLLLDEYTRNSSTGSFILIDPNTNGTVAAGMVLRDVAAQTASPNTVRHKSSAVAEARPRGKTVWFTGLSGSGKSSVAMLVEQKLLENGTGAYVLDGDNLRHGLNADLGFSMADRAENLRRLAHVAALLADCGNV